MQLRFFPCRKCVATATLLLVFFCHTRLGLTGCTAEQTTPAGDGQNTATASSSWHQTVTRLGDLPRVGADRDKPFQDDHGRHYGLVLDDAHGKRLWLDGQLQPVFDSFATEYVTDAIPPYVYAFSLDGKHLAYAVGSGGKEHMVLDGQAGPPADQVYAPTFSADGRHLGYVANRAGQWYAFIDGVPGPAGDMVESAHITFSADGKHNAYVLRRGGKGCLVLDQKEQPDWPLIGTPIFSPDGNHLACSTNEYALVDGMKGPQVTDCGSWSPLVFSTDSQHFAYSRTHRNPEGEVAFIDHYPLVLPNGGNGVWYTQFSPNLKRWACIVKKGSHSTVVLDGKESEELVGAYSLKFSPDNQRFVYAAELATGWKMMVDGKTEADISLDWAQPVFSKNGKRLAYIAGSGPMWWVMVDGQPGPQFAGTLKKRRGLRLGLDEEQWPSVTPPAFSPDSAHIAYGAQVGSHWHIMLDGLPQAGEYDQLTYGGPSFREDGALEFLGIRDGALYRVTIALEKV